MRTQLEPNSGPEPSSIARAPGSISPSTGWWQGPRAAVDGLDPGPQAALTALASLAQPVFAIGAAQAPLFVGHGQATLGAPQPDDPSALPLLGYAAPLRPEALGDPRFAQTYGARFAYMTGSMANGIASTKLVIAARRSGLVASYGAAGETLDRVARSLDKLDAALGTGNYCVNLIHSPSEPDIEAGLVELFLARTVRQVEASAYLSLTAHAVRFRVTGAYRDAKGLAQAANRIIAKASRVEVATHWLSAPPAKLVARLREAGLLTASEAALAPELTMADDLTAEADSGGHTDNRPAITLLPTFIALRDRLQSKLPNQQRTRIGAAGGIATPLSVAAAFSMGAAYVVTGTVNQACQEAGTSEQVRQMLAQAEQADVTMAPAADMFEMGVKLQVLKRGTLFPMRAARLFEIYRAHEGLASLPVAVRTKLEKDIFRAPLEEIWDATREFFSARNPELVARAGTNPKLQMALVFRWYLGLSSRWANHGKAQRQADFQIWCGPAMGAFNEWTKGSVLEHPAGRTVGAVALTLLSGAALSLRAQTLARSGVPVPQEALQPKPSTVSPLLQSDQSDQSNWPKPANRPELPVLGNELVPDVATAVQL